MTPEIRIHHKVEKFGLNSDHIRVKSSTDDYLVIAVVTPVRAAPLLVEWKIKSGPGSPRKFLYLTDAVNAAKATNAAEIIRRTGDDAKYHSNVDNEINSWFLHNDAETYEVDGKPIPTIYYPM